MAGFVLGIYLTLKLASYCVVCYLGVTWLRSEFKNRYAAAALLGLGRLLLGIGLGLFIYQASTRMYAAMPDGLPRRLTTYLAVYVPTRWLEWSVMAFVITPTARSIRGLFLGAGATDRLWRCLGIGASCIADIPVMVVLGGLPVGRFFC